MYKRFFASIPSKIAAGALGAMLAGTVGAGALTGTVSLISDDHDVAASAEDVESDDVESDEVESDEVESDDVESEDADDSDGDVPDVPTSVSEAAHIHDFDEACGNHGKYVSHFARFGEEPECAKSEREAAEDEADDEADDEAVDVADVDHDEDADSDGDATSKEKKDKNNNKDHKKAAKAKKAKRH